MKRDQQGLDMKTQKQIAEQERVLNREHVEELARIERSMKRVEIRVRLKEALAKTCAEFGIDPKSVT